MNIKPRSAAKVTKTGLKKRFVNMATLEGLPQWTEAAKAVNAAHIGLEPSGEHDGKLYWTIVFFDGEKRHRVTFGMQFDQALVLAEAIVKAAKGPIIRYRTAEEYRAGKAAIDAQLNAHSTTSTGAPS